MLNKEQCFPACNKKNVLEFVFHLVGIDRADLWSLNYMYRVMVIKLHVQSYGP